MKQKISILGAGSWGTTLAVILSKKQNLNLKLWTPFPKQADSISKEKENKTFLPGVKLSQKVCVNSALDYSLDSSIIIGAVPVKYLDSVLKKVSERYIDWKQKIFLSVSKGIDIDTFNTPADMVKNNINARNLAVLSGPTIAKEVVKGIPTVATIASRKKDILQKLEKIFTGTNLRVYKSSDLKGVELAGALKNIIAIGCGISDGLGFGTNTKSALITRGLVEMSRFGSYLGAKANTFWGVSGLGDLATTCFSRDSRNRFVGEQIGRGKKLKDVLKHMNMVAEGVYTAKSVYRLGKKYQIDLPITKQVYRVLYKNKKPINAVKDLMSRPFKSE